MNYRIQQAASATKYMVGYMENTNEVIDLPFRCLRKPRPNKTIKEPYFCFVSSPHWVKQAKYCKPFMWLHCFKNYDFLPAGDPKYLFPESDFIDVSFGSETSNKIEYDYFYFTVNKNRQLGHGASNLYKGLENFYSLDSALVGLRGVVIVYYGGSRTFADLIHRKVKSVDKCITTFLSPNNVGKIMSKCRFGIFPNHADCSPRMIPETFIRNRPILLNKNIFGGWHYLEQNSGLGEFFDPKKTKLARESIHKILSLPNNQRELWSGMYGFEKSSRKLASLIKKHYPGDLSDDISHMYFKEYEQIFEDWKTSTSERNNEEV